MGSAGRGTPGLLKEHGARRSWKQVYKQSILNLITEVTELLKKLIAKSKMESYKAEDTSSSNLNEDHRIRESDLAENEVAR